MLIELHVLQNFAPSNLNRDDTGAPKSCQFGGVMRARVSSQCWKRAARGFTRERGLLTGDELGYRTKRLKAELTKRLVDAGDAPFSAQVAPIVAEAAVRSFKAKMKNDLTSYLLFVGEGEVQEAIEVCQTHRQTLESYAQKVAEQQAKKEAKANKKQTPAKAAMETEAGSQTGVESQTEQDEADESLAPEVKISGELKKNFDEFQKAIVKTLDMKSAADVAMFGRMLADLPEKNIDAACQVAHPISTHAVSRGEDDYFTAMDDLQPKGEPGAGQIGTTEFNSACYYRYANIDTEQLATNLNGNDKLAKRAARAFLQAFVRAIPTGKQNSYASPTPPSFVLAVVREHGLCSLANAYESPVRASETGGVVKESVRRLDEHFGLVNKMFGEFNDSSTISVCGEHDANLGSLKPHAEATLKAEGADNLSKLINRTLAAAFGGKAGVSNQELGR